MPKCFVGNFDFEHSLAGGNAQTLSRAMQTINAELAAAWVAIAKAGDVIVLPELPDDNFQHSLTTHGFPDITFISNLHDLNNLQPSTQRELIPWGATTAFRKTAEQFGLQYNQPAENGTRQANSRLFATALETELQVALPGMATVRSLEEIEEALQRLPATTSDWVVKHEFSNSARERILGQGRELSEQQINWLQKRWDKKFPLFFEPWVEKIAEVGIHFTLPQLGKPHFDGVTPLLTDRAGRYCGSRISAEMSLSDDWQPAIETCAEAALRLQQMGYFGPVSIDAMRYRNNAGEVLLRPLQDINARYSMGRLALGFRKLLQPGEVASWLHYPASIKENNWPTAVRIIPTSPPTWNGQPVAHRSRLCIAGNLETLTEFETHVQASRGC